MTSSNASILGPDDPPPYSIVNERGEARVLLVGDHVSNVIPKSLDNLGLDEAKLQQHIAYDIGTRKLINHLVEHLDAPAVLASYSRLVVDLNRSLEDPSVMPEVSDDVVIPGNQNMSREHRNERIHCCYTPYRKAIDTMLHRFRENGVVPAFISIHSFTPQMAGFVRPWHAGILWDLGRLSFEDGDWDEAGRCYELLRENHEASSPSMSRWTPSVPSCARSISAAWATRS